MNKKKLDIHSIPSPPSGFMTAFCLCRTPGLNLHTSCLSPLRGICNCDCHYEEEENDQ